MSVHGTPTKGPASSDDNLPTEPLELPFAPALSHSHPLLDPSRSPTFSADDFLLSFRPANDLGTINTDLKNYLTSLKEELVQLINEDYVDFIALGTGLKGEGERIERLQQALKAGQTEAGLTEAQRALRTVESQVERILDERGVARAQKTKMDLLLQLNDSVARCEALLLIPTASEEEAISESEEEDVVRRPRKSSGFGLEGGDTRRRLSYRHPKTGPPLPLPQRIQRVSAEHSQLTFLVKKAQSDGLGAFVGGLRGRIDEIVNTLQRDLTILLSELLRDDEQALDRLSPMPAESGGSGTPEDKERTRFEWLKECFLVYCAIGKHKEAEEVVKREVVQDWVRKTIHAGSIAAPQSPFASSAKTPSESPSPPHGSSSFFQARPNRQLKPPPQVAEEGDDPLARLYNEILLFVSSRCSTVCAAVDEVSQSSRSGPERRGETGDGATQDEGGEEVLDVFTNVVWAPIAERLMNELGQVIFVVGRTEVFHKNYLLTSSFLRQFCSLCPSRASLARFQSHPTYQNMLRRFQLPVYFQMRLREIVGGLEEHLRTDRVQVQVAARDLGFGSRGGVNVAGDEGGTGRQDEAPRFEATRAVVTALRRCWDEGVWLEPIGHRFWRLTLQIISRYKTWLDVALPDYPRGPPPSSSHPGSRTGSNTGSGYPSRPSTPQPGGAAVGGADGEGGDESLLSQLGLVAAEVIWLDREIARIWKDNMEPKLVGTSGGQRTESIVDDETVALQNILRTAVSPLLSSLLPSLSFHIQQLLITRCAENLRPVRSVLSQLRGSGGGGGVRGHKDQLKGGRPQPSYFVPTLLGPLKAYFSDAAGAGKAVEAAMARNDANAVSGWEDGGEVKPDGMVSVERWKETVFDEVASRYASVLSGMNKTYASLSRLKKGTHGLSFLSSSGSGGGGGGGGDEGERVRVQMEVDVRAFEGEAKALGVDVDRCPGWRQLLKAALAASSEGDA